MQTDRQRANRVSQANFPTNSKQARARIAHPGTLPNIPMKMHIAHVAIPVILAAPLPSCDYVGIIYPVVFFNDYTGVPQTGTHQGTGFHQRWKAETDEWTFVGFVKRTSDTVGTIVSKHKSGVAKGWILMIRADGYLRLSMYSVPGYTSTPTCIADLTSLPGWDSSDYSKELISTTPLPLNQFMHVAFVREHDLVHEHDKLMLYVDGKLQCIADTDGYWDDTLEDPQLLLGGIFVGSGTGSHFPGEIHRPRMYQERLSDADIKADAGKIGLISEERNLCSTNDASLGIKDAVVACSQDGLKLCTEAQYEAANLDPIRKYGYSSTPCSTGHILMQDQGVYGCYRNSYCLANGYYRCCTTECQPGTFGEDCQECPQGYFQDQVEQETCDACPSGYYSDILSMQSNQCKGCPQGRYGTEEGRSSSTQCTGICPAGRWSVQFGLTDPSQCTLCPKGTYSNPGSTSSSQCLSCPSNTYNNPGEPCTACPEGQISTPPEDCRYPDCLYTSGQSQNPVCICGDSVCTEESGLFCDASKSSCSPFSGLHIKGYVEIRDQTCQEGGFRDLTLEECSEGAQALRFLDTNPDSSRRANLLSEERFEVQGDCYTKTYSNAGNCFVSSNVQQNTDFYQSDDTCTIKVIDPLGGKLQLWTFDIGTSDLFELNGDRILSTEWYMLDNRRIYPGDTFQFQAASSNKQGFVLCLPYQRHEDIAPPACSDTNQGANLIYNSGGSSCQGAVCLCKLFAPPLYKFSGFEPLRVYMRKPSLHRRNWTLLLGVQEFLQ